MKVYWDIETVQIIVTKHFAKDYLQRWGWDKDDLRAAIRGAYETQQMGTNKFEVYVQKSGYKKIIVAYYNEENELVCISGAQGGKRI